MFSQTFFEYENGGGGGIFKQKGNKKKKSFFLYFRGKYPLTEIHGV